MRPRLLIPVAVALCLCSSAVAATGRLSGDPLQGQEWWLAHIGADQATPPGPGVPIVIIDSGVDASHPEFAGRPDTTYLDDQTVVTDAHGTAVASIAAAPANGAGIVGIYPQAVLEVWDASQTAPVLDASVAQGITAAAQHCPAVINLSLSSASRDPGLEDAILGAFHNGCLVVAAAGNDGERGNPPTYPGAYPHVLTVGATDANDAVASFSTVSRAVDLAAPGVGILSAVPFLFDPSGYENVSGTSMAAPMVAAAAAWVWTVRPTLDVTQIFELMRESARDIGPPGFDPSSGFGLLSIPAALAAPDPARDPNEPNDDVAQVKPSLLFADGEPPLTTPVKTSSRIAGRLDASEDPRDLYRIWVPAHRVVRVDVTSGGDAAARIWGPRTSSVDEGIAARRRDLKGTLVRGGKTGSPAYVEALLTGRSGNASYVLSVTASRR